MKWFIEWTNEGIRKIICKLINGTETIKNKEVFTSKLKFKKITMEDAGIYACGAINEAGIRYKEAKLTVEENLDYPDEPGPRPFGDHWKMVLLITAIVFLLIAVKCMACIRFMRSSSGEGSEKHRRRSRQIRQRDLAIDPNDTSDYEHVVTL